LFIFIDGFLYFLGIAMGARSAAANCILAMNTAAKSSFCMIFSELG
jgi:hypothetical protein